MNAPLSLKTTIATFVVLMAGVVLARAPDHELSEADAYLMKAQRAGELDVALAGDSRIARGLSPRVMGDFLKRRIANLGFNANSLAYEPYLKYVEATLDPTSSTPLVVIGVGPYELTPRSTKENGFIKYAALAKRRQLLASTWWERLVAGVAPLQLRNVSVGSDEYQRFQQDGFIDTWRAHVDENARLPRYRTKFANNTVGAAETALLLRYIEKWANSGIKVFGFEPPVSPGMIALEDELSGFNRSAFVREFEARGGKWIHIDPEDFQTYDGEHLQHDSAMRLSRKLAKELAGRL